jgi:hypothetical protein
MQGVSYVRCCKWETLALSTGSTTPTLDQFHACATSMCYPGFWEHQQWKILNLFSNSHRTVVVVNGETINVPLRPKVAKEFLDALAKQVCASIFNWLVKAIHDSTSAAKQFENLPSNLSTKRISERSAFCVCFE